MSLIYITGLSGSGKSTVCNEIKRMGFEAHDADGEGINNWYKISSGEIASREETDKPHTDDWYKKYSWQTSEKKIKELALRAKNKLIFVCGTSANEYKVWHIFDKTICLVVNKETIKKRLKTRTTNDFGKDKMELKMILDWNKTYPGDYLKMGAITVNANQSLDEVLDSILKIANK
jgi:dephospho-CoA kinase